MKYRSDIDGLRSLAIVPVIFYHFNFPFFTGGFLGVDVFFVISGFLITSLISKEIAVGSFSIITFYERRVLRIFPALFAVLIFSIVMGYYCLLPKEFEQLGNSVAATTLFGSNILFFFQDSYFDSASAFKPLLHTWSLAVEEQFYLLFPIFLILLNKIKRKNIVFCLIVGAATLSVLYNIWMMRVDKVAAFYLPMARAWELLAGAVVAYNFVPSVHNQRIRDLLGICGIFLIAGSVVFLREGGDPLLPIALWACLGAVLIIYSGRVGPTLASRFLSNPILVYIGKISYSLYLWHWILLVFYRLEINVTLHLKDKSLLFLATVVAAMVSTRYVERPFRKPEWVARQRGSTVLASAFGFILLFVGVGLSIDITGGGEARFPPRVTRIASFLEYDDPLSFRTDTCFLSTNSLDFREYSQETCL